MPPRTTRTDRESNGKGVDTKEIKNKHSSRPVGGAETGTGVERTRVAVAGPRLAECGTKRAGTPKHQQTLRPHIGADKPRGWDSEWRRAGQAECG